MSPLATVPKRTSASDLRKADTAKWTRNATALLKKSLHTSARTRVNDTSNTMSPEARRVSCLLVLALAPSSFAQTPVSNSEGRDAIAAILHALDQYQVVALGEIHGGERSTAYFERCFPMSVFHLK